MFFRSFKNVLQRNSFILLKLANLITENLVKTSACLKGLIKMKIVSKSLHNYVKYCIVKVKLKLNKVIFEVVFLF